MFKQRFFILIFGFQPAQQLQSIFLTTDMNISQLLNKSTVLTRILDEVISSRNIIQKQGSFYIRTFRACSGSATCIGAWLDVNIRPEMGNLFFKIKDHIHFRK